jgi:hypothetical protein
MTNTTTPTMAINGSAETTALLGRLSDRKDSYLDSKDSMSVRGILLRSRLD